jgi:probable rRNA maturation factor
MILDLTLEDHRWTALPLQRLANNAAQSTLSHLKIDPKKCNLSLLACSNQRIAQLNAGFRSRDSATNVLSWPATDLPAPQAGTLPEQPKPDFTGEICLGDIAIAWETCEKEARQAGIPMADHITHLLVHAVLHLLGYDHIRDPDATLMMQIEVEILGKLGIGNPY